VEQAANQVPPVEKKGKGRMVGILVALVLVLSAGAAGAVFAPRLLAKPAPADKEKAAHAEGEESEAADEHGEGEAPAEEGHEAEHEPEPEPAPTEAPLKQRAGAVGSLTELSPLVIDARAADGTIRHVKVVLVVETPKTLPAEEFKQFVPFAREAAISYLRTREFEQLADPKNFELLRKQLAKEIIDAVGKKHARRVLITDFVVQ
jgi:flagellar basal body-associated protein FliL